MAKKLYGTDPDQVPTNADLGTIAYQDAERPLLGQTTLKSAGTSLIVERTSDAPNLQLKGNGQNLGQIYAFQNGAGGNIAFYPANSVGTITQRMIINRDGNVTINNGNLVMGTSGTGIDFSATGDGSGTMTSELLDDYEEGTWTPTVYGHTTAGTTSGTLTGKYTKVGNLVFATVGFSNVSLSGAGGRLYIGGLPYTAQSGAPGGGLVTYLEGFNPTYFYSVDSDSNALTFVVIGSGTEGVFRPSVTQPWDNFVNAATSTWNSGGGSVYGSLQFTYLT